MSFYSFLTTIAAFALAIGLLVTIHELGHYWAARWCDVKILRFSIGFGRPLWLKKAGVDQTEWVIGVLPLGGYVKMADERDGSADSADTTRAFNNKTVWQRIFIVLAGPAANFMLAAFLYWALFVSGMPGTKPYLAAPAANSPAAAGGFAEFDLVTKVGDKSVRTWSEARLALLEAAVKRADVTIEVEESTGHRQQKRLNLDSIGKDDLDKDFLAKVGVSAYRMKVLPVLDEIVPGSAASRAGLRPGDHVLAVQGKLTDRWETLVTQISTRPGQLTELVVMRAGVQMNLTVTPESITENAKTFGRIGVKPRVDRSIVEKLGTVVRYGPVDAIPRALMKVWDMSIFSLKMMGRMLTGDVSWKNLSGPITIADYAGQSAQLGWIPYVTFLALISISLGVLNLLPIPVLDGGQLMYYIAEILKGSPVSEKVMEIGQQVGLTLLLGLTAFAFYNDIHRLVTG
ncbi:MAG: RIP metalloprotease RseP [Burkholderiales bacterium]|nr:RIP metalloprotease RseP [Burkholderiales bacterium]